MDKEVCCWKRVLVLAFDQARLTPTMVEADDLLLFPKGV